MKDSTKKKIKAIAKYTLIGGACFGLGVCATNAVKNKEIQILKADNFFQRQHIDYLKNLCEQKDKAAMGMASELLRKGSSLGGQIMQDLKMYRAA